jgi:hypothetical protein
MSKYKAEISRKRKRLLALQAQLEIAAANGDNETRVAKLERQVDRLSDYLYGVIRFSDSMKRTA